MNNAEQVAELTQRLINEGKSKTEVVWQTALACIGWPYVYGAWGEYCTPAERKKRYKPEHPTIKTKCKAFDGGSCDGCQWYPDGKRVRCFDCRGFTDWALKQVGIDLVGEGATSQWNTAINWTSKGKVKDGIPENTLVCLFKANGKTMEHTGLGLNGETVECSNGVEYHEKMASKWTDWAVPVGIETGPVPPAPPVPEGYAIVTGKNLALREGPSTGCKVLDRAPTGTQVRITAPPDDWEHVEYKGKSGYMMKKYLKEG